MLNPKGGLLDPIPITLKTQVPAARKDLDVEVLTQKTRVAVVGTENENSLLVGAQWDREFRHGRLDGLGREV
ncbi:MAG: hypothetical protein ACJA2W_002663 [Planctomycetota bacterium]|jgi:hypothetical protein